MNTPEASPSEHAATPLIAPATGGEASPPRTPATALERGAKNRPQKARFNASAGAPLEIPLKPAVPGWEPKHGPGRDPLRPGKAGLYQRAVLALQDGFPPERVIAALAVRLAIEGAVEADIIAMGTAALHEQVRSPTDHRLPPRLSKLAVFRRALDAAEEIEACRASTDSVSRETSS